MSKIQPVVLTAITANNTFLVTKRVEEKLDSEFHNCWQIPGGSMEFAESPQETAYREAREELGVEIEIIRLIPSVHSRVRGSYHFVLMAFLCKLKYPNDPIVLNEEASEYRWVTLSELAQLETTPFTQLLIQDASNLLAK